MTDAGSPAAGAGTNPAEGAAPGGQPAAPTNPATPAVAPDAGAGSGASLEALQAELKAVRQEAAAARVSNKALSAKVEEFEASKLTEAEKLQKRTEEAEAKLAAAQGTVRSKLLRAEVMVQATALKVVDTDAAFKLLDHSKIEWTEDGDPKNVADLLKLLLADKPYLIAVPSQASAANPARGAGGVGAEMNPLAAGVPSGADVLFGRR